MNIAEQVVAPLVVASVIGAARGRRRAVRWIRDMRVQWRTKCPAGHRWARLGLMAVSDDETTAFYLCARCRKSGGYR